MSNILERLKSEGILLAIVPLIGSLMAFAYETGYLTYFGVPIDVIDLSLYRIVVAMLWLSMVLAVVWALGARVIAVALSPNNAIKNVFLAIFLIVLISVIAWNIELRKEVLFAFLGSLVFPVLGLISWLMSEHGPIGKRLPVEIAAAVKDGQDIARKAETISDLYVGPVCFAVVCLALVGILGYWTAKVGDRFWVLNDEKSFFLVRKYGDAYVFKDYDPKTMKMGTGVLILTLGDEKRLTLTSVLLRGLSTSFGDTGAPDPGTKKEKIEVR